MERSQLNLLCSLHTPSVTLNDKCKFKIYKKSGELSKLEGLITDFLCFILFL